MALHTRSRSRIGALAAAALTFGGIVAAAPASADVAPAPDALAWGFKESFRNYVGGGMNTEPVGERITTQAPATFDGEGDEKLPYLFPVAAAVVRGTDSLAILTAGAVTYNFPSHYFTMSISDVVVVVEDGAAQLLADLDIAVTDAFNEFEPGEYHEDNVHIANVATVDVTRADGTITVAGSGVTLTSDGADFLPYSEGDSLDGFTATVPDAADTWVPQIAVSQTSGLDPEGSETVTVKGWGFDPAMNVNTVGRPPVNAGQPSGIYVVFGKFGDPWRPSEEVPSSERNVLFQRWAIPEPSKTQVAGSFPSVAGQLVEMGLDGTFTAELEVAPDVTVDGSYGVYTFAAGGATANPQHEFAVPLSFAEPAPEPVSVPAVTTAPKDVSIAVGATATFTAAATGADALQWQSRTGTGSWADVPGATASTLEVAATAVSQSGTQYRVVATNAGGSVSSAAATLTVTKAAAKVTVAVKKKVRFASKPTATVSVEAPAGVAATGAVVVKAGKKVVGKGTVRDGKATITLNKKLRPGSRSLVAEFAGNANVDGATSSGAKVKVKKAAARIKTKLAKKKVKAGKRAVVRVKVTAKGLKPSGKVKITITRGKKKVRTLTVKVKGGKYVKVRLPRLDKGKYKVKAKYQGSKTVTKKSAKKVTLRVR